MLLFILLNLEINFDYKTGTFLDENKEHELVIFYKIPRNQITYIFQKDKFIAELEILCKLTQKNKEFGNIDYIKDTVEDYDQINEKTNINKNIKIKAPPGKYNLELRIKDLNSQRIGNKESNVEIKELMKFQDAVAYSSIMLIEDTTIYLELYNFLQKNLLLSYRIEKDTICIAKTENIEISEKFINPIYIYLKKISYGYNLIKLIFVGPDYNFSIQDTIHREEPVLLKNYEKMVHQLWYIADKEETDFLLKVPIEKRETEWKKFWSKKDSVFGMDVEEEYFKRVNYANENFSCGIEGWKTDRGRIYIKLGPPDEIESHPFEIHQQPYEVWYYYNKGLKFIFVDKHGFGEYILTYPYYWDEKIQFK